MVLPPTAHPQATNVKVRGVRAHGEESFKVQPEFILIILGLLPTCHPPPILPETMSSASFFKGRAQTMQSLYLWISF